MTKRLLLFSTIFLLLACQGKQSPMEEENAVYYWRTDLRLDSAERAFLKQYHINKVYCRYFDVVMSDSLGPMPNATITFSDTLPPSLSSRIACAKNRKDLQKNSSTASYR